MRVAIIGAGLTGLTTGHALSQAGLSPVLYDKGRGVGGRLSTRRANNGLQFDHGAQYLSAKTPEFSTFLAELAAIDVARSWELPDGRSGTIGIPGMTAVAKYLARGLKIHQSVEIADITRGAGGWRVADGTYDRVMSTVPAPQAFQLLRDTHPIAKDVNDVQMVPNLTLMLALPETADVPFVTRRLPEDPIAWLACDSEKHGRVGPHCWVAQASLDWSQAHLELDKEEIAALMLPMVCDILRADPKDALYVSAHRWRYAMASHPLGRPFLTSNDGLFVGGDWALSARAEGAWQSGLAMAKAVLATL
ncbi:MAG: FAD-dependent oxidoreductase [Pseudomonadota bacterium]